MGIKGMMMWGALAVGLGLAGVEFDRGGTHYDFAAISERRFTRKTGQDNLFQPSGWLKNDPYFHFQDPALIQRIRRQVLPLVQLEQRSLPEGNLELAIAKDHQIEALAGANASNISGSWKYALKFQPSDQGPFGLEFDYESVSTGTYPTRACVLLYYTNQGRTTTLRAKPVTLVKGKRNTFRTTFEILPETDGVQIHLRFDGCGQMTFFNPRLFRETVDHPASVALIPGAFLDDSFALSQHDPAILSFAWKRNVSQAQWKVVNPELRVMLPSGVRLLEACPPLVYKGLEQGVHVFDMSKVKHRVLHQEGYDGWLTMPLLVTTDAQPGAALAAGAYWLSDEGREISGRKPLLVSVLPQIPETVGPRLFLNGFQPMGNYLSFAKPETKRLWAEFVGRTGSRWISGVSGDPEMLEQYRAHGVEVLTVENFWLANGYRIGLEKGKPDYAKFKSLGKSRSFDIRNGTCPVAIYRKSEYFQKVIVPMLEASMQGVDGIIANWEPFMFHCMGCFCDRCRDEFASYAKLSAEKVKAIWPQQLAINQPYFAQGVAFRSWQQAQVIKTLQEACLKAGSGKVGFIPQVAWSHVADTLSRQEECGEHDPLDYASSLTWLDPWGPYPHWNVSEPFHYEKGLNLDTYAAAKKVVSFIDQKLPEGKRPKLLALPNGLQGDGTWLSQPEGIAMEVLGFFVAGYDASTIYFFPKGLDNRYWQEQARANRLMALHEDLVVNGKRLSAVSVTPLSPYPTAKVALNPKHFCKPAPESLLQGAGFEKDGVVLAAVGNFWDGGEVFAKLRVSGLPEGTRYVLVEEDKGRQYVQEDGRGFTGRELASGVAVHVGALRWAFWKILPEDKAPQGLESVRPGEVESAMQARRQSLETALVRDTQWDAQQARSQKVSELKALTKGRLACQPSVSPKGTQVLQFTSGDTSLTLSLKGMAVTAWKVGGETLIAGSETAGLGAPAFWDPSKMFTTAFEVRSQRNTETGMAVTAELPLNSGFGLQLRHLLLRQTLEVSENLSRVRVRTSLVNQNNSETGMASIRVGFRYHLLPMVLGTGGCIAMSSQGELKTFKRQNRRVIWGLQEDEAVGRLSKLFEVPEARIPIDSNHAQWQTPDGKLKVDMTLNPAPLFAGYASWDTPDMPAPSLEPFFQPVTIPAEKQADFHMELKVVR